MKNKKQAVLAGALAVVLAVLPIAGCDSDSSSDDSSDDTTSEEEAEEEDEEDEEDDSTETSSEESETEELSDDSSDDESGVDASIFYGQWRGRVETTAESAYGSTEGFESMLDVYLYEDGTCSVEPCENHEDLLTDTGTWETDGTTVTLTLSEITIELTYDSEADELSGDPTDFDIANFDLITFVYYG